MIYICFITKILGTAAWRAEFNEGKVESPPQYLEEAVLFTLNLTVWSSDAQSVNHGVVKHGVNRSPNESEHVGHFMPYLCHICRMYPYVLWWQCHSFCVKWSVLLVVVSSSIAQWCCESRLQWFPCHGAADCWVSVVSVVFWPSYIGGVVTFWSYVLFYSSACTSPQLFQMLWFSRFRRVRQRILYIYIIYIYI